MADAKWMDGERQLARANEVITEARGKLLGESIDPMLVICALINGISETGMVLDIDDKLFVCGSLNKYIEDQKQLIVDCRN